MQQGEDDALQISMDYHWKQEKKENCMEFKDLREILAFLFVSMSLILNAWDSHKLCETWQVCFKNNLLHKPLLNLFFLIIKYPGEGERTSFH